MPQPNAKPHAVSSAEMLPSGYDRVAALLVASIAVLGALVALLFLAWLCMDAAPARRQVPLPFVSPPLLEETTTPASISGREPWQKLNADMFPESTRPELSNALQETVTAVTSLRAHPEILAESPFGLGHDGSDSALHEKGPDRIDGIDPTIVPESARWTIEYTVENRQAYMEILAFFDIQLAAVNRRGDEIYYVSDLLVTAPTFSAGTRREETRLGFRNTKSQLHDWEYEKLEQAGIEITEDKPYYAVQYYPESTCNQLRELERQAYEADGALLEEVLRTQFEIHATEDGYEFVVASIAYSVEFQETSFQPIKN